MSNCTAANGLCNVVRVNFVNFDGVVDVRPVALVEWSSVTFSGARHRLGVGLHGPGAVGAAADFLAVLPELEFDIPGHLVADAALIAEERGDGGTYAMLELELLTVEES